MTMPFVIKHALREARSTGRRLGVYMGAITLGVAALVAINSFRANITRSVESESKTLLGADLRLSSNSPFADSVDLLIDSLAATGHGVSRVTSTLSVALAPSGATRLVQLRAASGAFPFYGSYTTNPARLWGTLDEERRALVEPEVLAALDLRPGDSIRIGDAAFRIAGTVTGLPPEADMRSGIAPRVFIGGRWLADTGLLRFGSMARYQAYLRMPDADAARFHDQHRNRLRRLGSGIDTAREQAEQLASALDRLGRFLGLVGLAALLLGGLGVASAVHVFVADRRPTIAVLRCVGATQRTAFLAYLLQAGFLGLAGATLGAAAGIALLPIVPRVFDGLLPVDVAMRVHWPSVLAGLGIGVWVATLFSLLPLLAIRGVPPLEALRHEVQPERRPVDVARSLTFAGIGASIGVLAVVQAGRWQAGLVFAAGLAVTLLLLALAAWLLMRLTRRFFPRHARFVVRQGIASLFRPHNQTAAVTVALGFGVFLVATLWIVQRNLLRRFDLDAADTRANLVAFDIQSDQRDDVLAAFTALGLEPPDLVPIVPARIAAIDGRTVADILADRPSRIRPWALRREYRNTYRAQLSGAEELIEGEWWDVEDELMDTIAPGDDRALPRISIEDDLARTLGTDVGGRITWDVQGVPVETRIASTRKVDWARFETNFFVVFEPGALDDAPQSFVTLADVPDAALRAALQRDVVRRHANISFVDLTLVQQAIDRIIGRVALAVRFMGGFSILGGVLVLAGAIAASRFQRLRESVLLRTLGATRRQIRQVLVTEYLALGALAGLAGSALAIIAAWALVRFFLNMDFTLPLIAPVAACLAAATLAVTLGLANSRDALRQTPLAALRDAS